MKMFKTKQFNRWEKKQTFSPLVIETALEEVIDGVFEANLGGHLYKKRVAFAGKGKSGSGRLIICFKIDDMAIILDGFSKNESENISKKELLHLKEWGKTILNFDKKTLKLVLEKGLLIELLEDNES